MPMGDSFDGLFTLWHEKLREYCTISRADTTPNQRNIVRDIIRGISDCDLVIADLTNLNANVLYELGVAHGLDKPVILLSQDTPESLPFDLKSYRVLPYSPEISGALSAGDSLVEYCLQFISRESDFGNPVSDHLQRSIQTWTPTDELEAGDGGILDYFYEVEQGYTELTRIMEELSEGMIRQSQVASESTSQLESAVSTLGRRNVIQAFARSSVEHARHMSSRNSSLEPSVDNLGLALELALQHIDELSEDDLESARTFEQTLEDFDSQVEFALSSIYEYRETWENMPNVQRQLNQAKRVLINSINALCQTFESLKSSNARALRILRQKMDGSGE